MPRTPRSGRKSFLRRISVQFLDAFSEYAPTTTVAQLQDGETKLVTLDGEKLAYWLRNYSLGALFSSGELENMAADALDEANEDAAGGSGTWLVVTRNEVHLVRGGLYRAEGDA